jgi:hypothetical protein
MISQTEIFQTAFIPGALSAFVWTMVMLLLRRLNFTSDGKRCNDWRQLTPDLRSKEIEYHNNATYKAFEFYITVLLAVFGGLAFVAINEKGTTNNAKTLIDAAGWVIVVVSALIVFLMFSHQKAKIERWKRRYGWFEPLLWNECWFCCGECLG